MSLLLLLQGVYTQSPAPTVRTGVNANLFASEPDLVVDASGSALAVDSALDILALSQPETFLGATGSRAITLSGLTGASSDRLLAVDSNGNLLAADAALDGLAVSAIMARLGITAAMNG